MYTINVSESHSSSDGFKFFCLTVNDNSLSDSAHEPAGWRIGINQN
jgi:hypothetical protein